MSCLVVGEYKTFCTCSIHSLRREVEPGIGRIRFRGPHFSSCAPTQPTTFQVAFNGQTSATGSSSQVTANRMLLRDRVPLEDQLCQKTAGKSDFFPKWEIGIGAQPISLFESVEFADQNPR